MKDIARQETSIRLRRENGTVFLAPLNPALGRVVSAEFQRGRLVIQTQSGIPMIVPVTVDR